MRERLIGAIVLVIAAVILIPWLVSRAHHPQELVRTLPLPAAATTVEPTVLSLPPIRRSSPDPMAAAHTATVPTVTVAAATRLHPATKARATKPAAAHDRAAGKSAAKAGGWYVQVASFTARDSAKKLAGQLSQAGFHAYVSSHAVKSNIWYRVRVGSYPDAASARAATTRIAKLSGTRAIVRQNDGSGD